MACFQGGYMPTVDCLAVEGERAQAFVVGTHLTFSERVTHYLFQRWTVFLCLSRKRGLKLHVIVSLHDLESFTVTEWSD